MGEQDQYASVEKQRPRGAAEHPFAAPAVAVAAGDDELADWSLSGCSGKSSLAGREFLPSNG